MHPVSLQQEPALSIFGTCCQTTEQQHRTTALITLLSCAVPWCTVLQGPKKRAGAMFTIGVVGRCLSKALVQAQPLTPKCRELVLIAAPKDSRVYLQYPESASALVQKIAELQRAAGVWWGRTGRACVGAGAEASAASGQPSAFAVCALVFCVVVMSLSPQLVLPMQGSFQLLLSVASLLPLL